MKRLFLALIPMLFLGACDQSSDEIQRQQQEQLNKQAVDQVGMPAITNFAEKRMMKDILEARDHNVATMVYVKDINGKYHKYCDSVGYGLPYSTQYTNPMRVSNGGPLPQADPNGLFSPSSAEGTWVVCVNPKTGKLADFYVEDRVSVGPWPPLNAVD